MTTKEDLDDVIRDMAYKVDYLTKELFGDASIEKRGRIHVIEMKQESNDMRIAANHKDVSKRLDDLEKKNEKWDFKKDALIWVTGGTVTFAGWLAAHPYLIKFLIMVGLIKQVP